MEREPQRTTLADLEHLLECGGKLCSLKDHRPCTVPSNPGGIKPEAWRICFATPPVKLGKLSLTTSDNETEDTELDAPDHQPFQIPMNEKADKFATEILAELEKDRNRRDPTRFLVPVDKTFIRLDVSKFSGGSRAGAVALRPRFQPPPSQS